MSSTPKPSASSKPEEGRAAKPSFDERLAQLDQLVLEIEGGKLGLEESMQRYQQGMQLYQELKAEIEAHRQRFQELAADGSLVAAKDTAGRVPGRSGSAEGA